jgi:hypothetical protein
MQKSQIPKQKVLVLFNVASDRIVVRYLCNTSLLSVQRPIKKLGYGTDLLFNASGELFLIVLFVK